MTPTRSREDLLDNEPIPRLLLQFSLPTITGMLVSASYNIIDRIFIGQGIGSLGIAAVTAGFPVMLIQIAFGQLVGIGGASLTSIRMGQQRTREAELVIAKSFGLTTIISVILMSFGQLLIVPALKLFGITDEVLPHSVIFLRILLGASMLSTITMGWNNFIRAQGDPRTAMNTMVLSALTNVVLAPLFIMVFHWGIAGAAWATTGAMAVSSIYVLSYFLRGRSTLKIHWNELIIRRSDIPLSLEIMSVGIAPFLMQLAGVMVMAIYNHGVIHYAPLSGYSSDLGLAATGIVLAVNSIVLFPLIGLNMGAQPIIGYSFGARKYDRVKQTVVWAMAAATIYAFCWWLPICLHPSSVTVIFNGKDAALIDLSSKALRYCLAALPLMGVQVVASNYFQAMGKAKMATLLTLSRQLIFLIPCMLIIPQFLGISGIFISQAVADVLAATVTLAVFLRDYRRLENTDDYTGSASPIKETAA